LKQNLMTLLDKINGQKVLIVGDVGLDEYVMGQVSRISPEAPVPVVDVKEEDSRLGLTANVAANVTTLGGEPLLLSVVGEDEAANQFSDLLLKNGVSKDHLVVDSKRPTTRKLRIIAQQQQVVRVDYEKKSFITQEIETQLLNKAEKLMPHVSVVILQDYAKGVVSETLSQGLIAIAHKHKKSVFVDPSRYTPLEYYKGVDLIKPNRDEAIQLSGISVDELRETKDIIQKVGAKIREDSHAKYVIITEGQKGMQFFSQEEQFQIPTYARQVFDVTGAGDTVISALALAWSAGANFKEACTLANFAAGVVVGHVGCVSCEVDELKNYIETH